MNDIKIVFVGGDTPTFEFEVYKNGTPFPLDNVTINFVMATHGTTIPVLTKTTNNFTILNNKATLALMSNDTLNLSDLYDYQITYTDVLGNIDTVEGLINIRPKIQN